MMIQERKEKKGNEKYVRYKKGDLSSDQIRTVLYTEISPLNNRRNLEARGSEDTTEAEMGFEILTLTDIHGTCCSVVNSSNL